jgi:hypothetical protein
VYRIGCGSDAQHLLEEHVEDEDESDEGETALTVSTNSGGGGK